MMRAAAAARSACSAPTSRAPCLPVCMCVCVCQRPPLLPFRMGCACLCVWQYQCVCFPVVFVPPSLSQILLLFQPGVCVCVCARMQ